MDIPVEVVINHIIPHCEVKSVVNLMMTCKEYRDVDLWLYLLERDFNPVFDFCKGFIKGRECVFYKHLFERQDECRRNGELRKIAFFRGSRDEMARQVFCDKHPEFDLVYPVTIKSIHPIASELLDILWRRGKISGKCIQIPKCKCFDCTLKSLLELTDEQKSKGNLTP